MNKFLPDLADMTAPLRELLSTKSSWMWDYPQKNAFETIKKALIEAPALGIFDVSKESVLSADASSYGLGAVLRQKQEDGELKPIAYISRSLSETEKRYAQIEKEALAITWACERLNNYLLGTKFKIETDHKPLVPLLGSKNLSEMPPRIPCSREEPCHS